MQTLLSPPVTKPKKPKKPRKPINFNFSGLVDRLRLGPQEAKVAVVIFFTVCWMVVAVVRSYAPHDAGAPETSSLMSLAKLFKQGAIGGRDFHYTFGPGMQFLAWAAVSITTAGAPVDAYGILAFFFCALSAVLIALMLLVCDRISWLDSVIVYAFCFFLNLFFGILDFRIALLLLSAVLAYRITAAEDTSRQLIWATATGLLCFISQLVSFELAIYEVLVIASALMASWLLSRDAGTFLGIEVLIATLAAANAALVFLFKLTSANYAMAFDYQNYSLEIIRGYHNTMGVLWQLTSLKTAVLFLGVSFAVAACIMVARESGLLEAPLYFSLAIAATIWVTTGFVRSDTPHIVAAFTPMVVVLAILGTRVWRSKPLGVAWAVAVGALLAVWPAFNLS